MLSIRTILHPTDFSDCSRYAFDVACALARDYGARMVLLCVIEPSLAFGDGSVSIPLTFDFDTFKDLLNKVKPADSSIAVERELLSGDPAQEILQTVNAKHCDLIVMGTHGRSGLGRLLMGSVAERVVRHATCPVLTVKAPQCLETQSKSQNTETATGKA